MSIQLLQQTGSKLVNYVRKNLSYTLTDKYVQYTNFLTSKKNIARSIGYLLPFTAITLVYEKFGVGFSSADALLSRSIPLALYPLGLSYLIEKADSAAKKTISKKELKYLPGYVDNIKSMLNIGVGGAISAASLYALLFDLPWQDLVALSSISGVVSLFKGYPMNAVKKIFYSLLNVPSEFKTPSWVNKLNASTKKTVATSIVVGSLAVYGGILIAPSVRVLPDYKINKQHKKIINSKKNTSSNTFNFLNSPSSINDILDNYRIKEL